MNTSVQNYSKKNSKTPKATKLRRAALRWHRRIGIVSAVVVLALSVSGIALNHIDKLFNQSKYVSSSKLLDWYAIPSPNTVISYSSNSQVTQSTSNVIWSDGTILVNSNVVLFNQTELLGVIPHNSLLYLFTQNAAHIFTSTGQSVESLVFNNALPFKRVIKTSNNQIVAWVNSKSTQFFNLEQFSLVSQLTATPKLLEDTDLLSENKPNDIKVARSLALNKSKVLLDLHSGRLFGKYGSIVLDLFALAFCILALSGLYLWFKSGRKRI